MPQASDHSDTIVTTRAALEVAFSRWYRLLCDNPEPLMVEHGPDFPKQATDQLLQFLRTQSDGIIQ